MKKIIVCSLFVLLLGCESENGIASDFETMQLTYTSGYVVAGSELSAQMSLDSATSKISVSVSSGQSGDCSGESSVSDTSMATIRSLLSKVEVVERNLQVADVPSYMMIVDSSEYILAGGCTDNNPCLQLQGAAMCELLDELRQNTPDQSTGCNDPILYSLCLE